MKTLAKLFRKRESKLSKLLNEYNEAYYQLQYISLLNRQAILKNQEALNKCS